MSSNRPPCSVIHVHDSTMSMTPRLAAPHWCGYVAPGVAAVLPHPALSSRSRAVSSTCQPDLSSQAGGGGGRSSELGTRLVLVVALAAGADRSLRGSRRARLGRRGRARRAAVSLNATSDGELAVSGSSSATDEVPENFYDLLGVAFDAEPGQIKKAYLDKMKVCHPDIAGEEGEEMCMLLNDAYTLLSEPVQKAAYDEEVQLAVGPKRTETVARYSPGEGALGPTWDWTAKVGNKKDRPTYTGRPWSRSQHAKWKDSDEVGQKWREEKFVFVDEWSCIACRNCCDVAPRTFCIDADAGRARAFAQWGNEEESLDYAVSACPVDCIHWVSREELQVLEYVTREHLYDTGNQLPCPMAAQQGYVAGIEDPFYLAREFERQDKEEKQRKQRAAAFARGLGSAAAAIRDRIKTSWTSLSVSLRTQGWG
ncbi:unnamed protein product [Polarella glacialis]|uniref:J domain-containing protein n=1 Tax=Polarella glacialis TaxID=89957 RepID=A0A813G7E4_POLGL|nr:unnamed protein product [Polarella glacialis]